MSFLELPDLVGIARLLSEAFLLPLLMEPRSLLTGSFQDLKEERKLSHSMVKKAITKPLGDKGRVHQHTAR